MWKIECCYLNVFKVIDVTVFAICHDFKYLLHSFTRVDFMWIKREVNSIAHALAKFASQSHNYTFCNIDSLPPSVYEAWLKDIDNCD